MTIEQQYLTAQQLTQQMLAAAVAQNWDALTQLNAQRSALLSASPPLASLTLTATQAGHLAEIITDMERDNGEILEIVEVLQEHTKILLRIGKP
jgi:hypothetical protein